MILLLEQKKLLNLIDQDLQEHGKESLVTLVLEVWEISKVVTMLGSMM